MLARINHHPRDEFIEFDEEPHIYYIHGVSKGWTSVTTFVHEFFAEFNGFFAARAMVRGRKFPHGDPKYKMYLPLLLDEKGQKRSEPDLIQAIQDKWAMDSNVACTLGTYLHKSIEDFYNQAPLPDPLPSDWEYFLAFDEKRVFDGFTPYRTEWMIYSEEDMICGSIDMIMYRDEDGTYHMFDWKRSKAIRLKGYRGKKGVKCLSHLQDCNYIHYSLQLSIYTNILERKYDLPMESMSIVVFHPSNPTFQAYELKYHKEEVESMFKWRQEERLEPEYKTCHLSDLFQTSLDTPLPKFQTMPASVPACTFFQMSLEPAEPVEPAELVEPPTYSEPMQVDPPLHASQFFQLS